MLLMTQALFNSLIRLPISIQLPSPSHHILRPSQYIGRQFHTLCHMTARVLYPMKSFQMSSSIKLQEDGPAAMTIRITSHRLRVGERHKTEQRMGPSGIILGTPADTTFQTTSIPRAKRTPCQGSRGQIEIHRSPLNRPHDR